MSLEFKIEHYGALPADETTIKRLVGDDLFGTLDYMIDLDNDKAKAIVSISGTPKSNEALGKTIRYFCGISDSINILEL